MNFDYVIVGAGAAGCALANRLSADPGVHVLLLEAGARRVPWATRVPRALPLTLRSRSLTSYATEPPPGRPSPDYWVRGRGLGGSTLVNGMMYLRGEPAAYDELAAIAGPEWGWDAFAEAYDEIERDFLHPAPSSLNRLDHVVLDALAATGLPVVADLNAAAGPRVGATPATIHRGRRRSAAAAFLDAARTRPNLRVLTSTSVGSLIWQGNRVVGLHVSRGGHPGEIRARTIVLAAGTIETPLLLERSGVGRADVLHAAGIPLRIESPHVGERVLEQHGAGLQVRLRDGIDDALELGSAGAVATAAARYLVGGRGPLARPAYDLAALLATGGGDVDLQALIAPFALASGDILRPAAYPGLLLAGYPLRPEETGSVHLTPDDPSGVPVITAPEQPAAHGVRTLDALRGLISKSSLRELVIGEDYAGADAPGASIYHAVGSAAMGPADDDVVDPTLRVRGAQGLHIADLSVLPLHPSGGTAAVAMAIGWRAGDLLLREVG